MADSVLRVIIDSSAAQAGAQAVTAAIKTIDDAATKAIQSLLAMSNSATATLQKFTSLNFSSMSTNFESAITSMQRSLDAFSRGFKNTFDQFDLSARGLGKNLGNGIQSGLDSIAKGIKNTLMDVFSLSLVEDFLQKIAKVGTEVQRFKTVTGDMLGGQSQADAAFENAMKTADKYGLSVNSLMQPYTRLIAATKETALTTKQVDTMFKGIAAAASTYHLSQQDVNYTMLAFNQMISKGTVSMEELRRQLAERIPGTFEMAAKTIGKTTAELEQLIKTGQLKGPEFAAMLGQSFLAKFGDTAEKVSLTFFGAMNRMDNAVFRFFNTLATSGVLDAFTQTIETFIQMLTGNESAVNSFGDAIAKLVLQFNSWLKTVRPEDIANLFNAIATGVKTATTAIADLVKYAPEILGFLGALKGLEIALKLSKNPWGAALGAATGAAIGYGAGTYATSEKAQGLVGNNGPSREVSGRIKQPEFFTDDQFVSAASVSAQSADLNPFKTPKAKKGLSDGQKSFRRAESVFENYEKSTRDFFNALSPRKAASNVPTIDEERIENVTKAANSYNDVLNKLNDQRRDGMISSKDYALGLDRINVAYDKQLKQLDEVLEAREAVRRSEAKEVKTTVLKGFDNKVIKMFDDLNQALDPMPLDRYQKKIFDLSATVKGNLVEAQKILQDQLNSGKLLPTEYADAMDELTEAYYRQIKGIEELVGKKKTLDQDFNAGFSSGLKSYADTMKTTFETGSDIAVKAFKGMEDALTQFVMTGKLDFKSLADSIIADMIRMTIQESITKPLTKSLLGFLSPTGSAASASSTAAAGTVNNAGWSAEAFSLFASGGIINSPSLSAFSGNVYDSPHLFKFADGAGVFGEAGPEAIIPLKRGSDGQLGIASTGSANTTIVVNVKSTTGNTAEIKRSAAEGARSALNLMSGARRYG